MNANSPAIPLVANRLCLDFVNSDVGGDRLATYQDLVDWARQAGALDGAEADYVLERWSAGPDADAALDAARLLRRQLRALADQLTGGSTQVAPAVLEAINLTLRNRPGYLQVERSGGEWAGRWKVPLRRADDVLWRIARSAASLLTDDDLTLVRRCERSACGLFFYDTTKNHRKRFCRMAVCGASERAAAYYRRRKSG